MDPADRSAALRAAINSTGEDRQWLVDEIATLAPEDTSTTKLISSLAYEWGPRDPGEVIQWIHQLPPSPARTQLGEGNGRRYAKEWATNDLETAIPWLESLDPDDPMRPNMVRGMADGWARVDFDSAQEWANQIADDAGRHHALDSMISAAWGENLASGREILIAATMGLSSEESEPFARSVRHIAIDWGGEDPAGAFAWAGSLSNEQQRSAAFHEIVNKWQKADPDEAREAIEAAELDDDLRGRLLGRIRR